METFSISFELNTRNTDVSTPETGAAGNGVGSSILHFRQSLKNMEKNTRNNLKMSQSFSRLMNSEYRKKKPSQLEYGSDSGLSVDQSTIFGKSNNGATLTLEEIKDCPPKSYTAKKSISRRRNRCTIHEKLYLDGMRRKEKREGSKNKSFMVKKWDEILRNESEEGSENKSASPSRSRTRPTSNFGAARKTSVANRTYIDLKDLAIKQGWNKSIKVDPDLGDDSASKRSREFRSNMRKSPKFGKIEEETNNRRIQNSIMKSKRYMEYSPVPEPDDQFSKDGLSTTRNSTQLYLQGLSRP